MTESIQRVAPTSLLIAANVRTDTKLSKEFIASIKQHGVMVPITAQETADGLAVIDGQRRTLAAVDAGVDLVPVFVVDPLKDEGARIVEQLVVNDQREEIGAAETVAAVKQLELFGMSATAIAKKVGMPKKTIDVVLKVGSSERATAAMAGQVSFESATLIAEFEGDEEAQSDLVERSAGGYGIAHYAQQWRDKRFRAAVEAEIESMSGVSLIEQPNWDQNDPKSVDNLYLDEAMTQPLADVNHEKLVEVAGDGLCAFAGARRYGEPDDVRFTPRYAVSGWKARGLFGYEYANTSKPSTPEEAEALKAQRRADRETTKAWVSATAVRVAWIQELLQRKTLPKGWDIAVAAHMTEVHSTVQWNAVGAVLQVEMEPGGYVARSSIESALQAQPTRAPHIMLGIALGSVEGSTDFEKKGWQKEKTPAYLRLLQGWGYQLSEVESSISGVAEVAA